MTDKEVLRYAKIATNHYYNSKSSNFSLLDWLKARELVRTNDDVKKSYDFLTKRN